MSPRTTASFLIFVLFVSLPLLAQTDDSLPNYKNPNLSIEERVNDLASRMTLEEKVSQMMNAAKAIPRLDIPAYDWWNESLHGVARAGFATVFPQSIGLAATWDTDLMSRVADAISTEARAKNNDCLNRGDCNRYEGLTVWSPNINIFRDPRWGRGQETYGEDPYLTSRMGVEFVKGLQGNDPKYFKVISTPKHYAIHSGPESERHRFNAVIDERDLYDTYLPAFEACVREDGAYSVMCAYNRYQGDACCANSTLLKKILREDWGFTGYVTTDCGAIYDMYMFHKTVPDKIAGSAAALRAGTDLECGSDYGSLVQAVKQGLVTEAEVDVALKRLLTARFRLGMFDPPEMNPYRRIPIAESESATHRQLSLQAARESIVLLKNADNLLPLKKDLKKIAVIGPTADDYMALLGDYYGLPSTFVTPLKGIQNKVSPQTQVVYEQGSNLVEDAGVLQLIPNSSLSTDDKAGLKAEYFNNRDLSGKPLLTRIDPVVDSNWLKLEKVPGLKTTDFSVRWSRTLIPATPGTYVIAVTGDDGYRLWLDGKLVIDNWKVYGSGTIKATTELKAGKSYQIKQESFHSPN